MLKKPGNGRLNNLNDPVLNVLRLGQRFGKFENRVLTKIFGPKREKMARD